ncbi:MAG: alanyl-tRNA editing protein AlaXM [Candidatus Bathyarchaeota archaeon]|nr:alanyl-tRNA editing protein AlaXM [Candidatus Bathyarchaeota archaeon]MCZ2844996.1 alanyl-tRNA editing protein AlaXM [Candidatus Bathyarchaeota archaeon]
MIKALFLEDSYLKECEATVVAVSDGNYIVLDQTVFYPKGGGQPHDTGKIIHENNVFNTIYVGKFKGSISHEVDKVGLNKGDKVHCILDWKRRYKLMRNHTAAHTLAAILEKETGALITGNQLEEDKVRFDFNLENFSREIFQTYIDKANELFKKDIPVKWYEVLREEAVKIPGVTKLANALPPNIPVLRIVEIQGLDKQADGGTHVKNLKEVGAIEMIKAKNKGKNNRRVYFRLTS